MSRVKIEIPGHFTFSTTIPIRITDINYGGHVGNDSILSIIHEARMLFLKEYDYDELNLEGAGLIMSDVAIEFKNELFYGDQLKVSVQAGNFSKVAFSIYYKLEKESTGEENKIIAMAKTGMVCYDYKKKKVTPIPASALAKLNDSLLPG